MCGDSGTSTLDKIVILDEKLFSIAALQGGGGPKLSVSTFAQPDNPVEKFRQPHFYINGSLTLLGIKQGLYASVSVQGIDFELVGQLVPGVEFDLDARFGKTGIGATGKVKVGVGTFTQLPSLLSKKVEEALTAVFKDMNQWANAVKNGVMDGVDDSAKVFKEVYGKSEQEAKALAGTVNKDLGKATHAVENVAKDVGKATGNTAKKVSKKAKFW